MTTAIKSISVSVEFDELAKKYSISWSEAARVGLSLMLADLGVKEYDNNLNLFRKMTYFRQELEKLQIKINQQEV
jgi:hypothetical protein